FAVACCRRIWDLLTDVRSRKAVEVAEQYSDGLAKPEELRAASMIAHEHALECNYGVTWVTAGAAFESAERVASGEAEIVAASTANARGMESPTGEAESAGWDEDKHAAEYGQQAALLRCLFGPLPFRQVQIDLSWLTLAVVALATALYEERRWEEMPVLGD